MASHIIPANFQKTVSIDKIANNKPSPSFTDYQRSVAFFLYTKEKGYGDLISINIAKNDNWWSVLCRKASIMVFDHDKAFEPWVGRINKIFGSTSLPKAYTVKFIKSLKALSPNKIHKLLDTILTPLEVEALIFRRAVIPKDFELRGGPLLTQ